MNKTKSFLAAGILGFAIAGCESPPVTPQERAAVMIDAQIERIQTDISQHSGRLPSDRDRWSLNSMDIERQLYGRLDDLNRQRQVLAVELGNQKFDPKTAPSYHPKAKADQ
jgi:hypothetical protein